MTANSLGPSPRTRASGAMSDGCPATPAPDSVAVTLEAHPTTARATAALVTVRVVFVMAFPPAGGHQAVDTLECGNARLRGEPRQKRSQSGRSWGIRSDHVPTDHFCESSLRIASLVAIAAWVSKRKGVLL